MSFVCICAVCVCVSLCVCGVSVRACASGAVRSRADTVVVFVMWMLTDFFIRSKLRTLSW